VDCIDWIDLEYALTGVPGCNALTGVYVYDGACFDWSVCVYTLSLCFDSSALTGLNCTS
jgi:hypothetical protein